MGGVQTDLSFLRWLADEPGFAAGDYDTDLVEAVWAGGPDLGEDERAMAARAAIDAHAGTGVGRAPDRPMAASPGPGAWAARARLEAVSRGRRR